MINILSFPRSGNHFVRYIIEYLTGRCTIGATGFTQAPERDSPICLRIGPKYLSDVDISNPIAKKVHFSNDIDFNGMTGLVLILRHPMESILSHRFYELKFIQSGKRITSQEFEVLIKDTTKYLENIEFYEFFNGPKQIILYEDLVGENYINAIEGLDKIFNFNKNKLSEFINNFEKYKIDSMKSPLRSPISVDKNDSKINFYMDHIKTNIDNFKVCEEIYKNYFNITTINKYYA